MDRERRATNAVVRGSDMRWCADCTPPPPAVMFAASPRILGANPGVPERDGWPNGRDESGNRIRPQLDRKIQQPAHPRRRLWRQPLRDGAAAGRSTDEAWTCRIKADLPGMTPHRWGRMTPQPDRGTVPCVSRTRPPPSRSGRDGNEIAFGVVPAV
jgi:hypothetical protein